jgi:hypothetical protein
LWRSQDALLTLRQAANSQGIQTLLEAEKEAAKVVQKARQCMCTDVHIDALFADTGIRPCAEAQGRQDGGGKGDRGVQGEEGGRVQEV